MIDKRSSDYILRRRGASLVFIASLFNCVLCFVDSHAIAVTLPAVAITELAIIAGAIAIVWRSALHSLLIPCTLITLYIISVGLVSPLTDRKIAVEFAMMAGFFLLGFHTSTPASAHRVICILALTVLGFGLFEYMAQGSFESTFNVFNYYVGKGTLDIQHAGDTGTTLAENGVRPEGEGRQLLPGLLGLHRVGSIFLEPISAGNFATICAAWVIARNDFRFGGLLLLIVGFVIGILADARFAVFSSFAIFGLLITPFWRSRLLITSFPFFAVAGLCVFGTTHPVEVDNSIVGRLYGSGALLDGWTWADWFGLARPERVSMDTGYSYLFGSFGAIACSILWITVAWRQEGSEAAARFFAAISLYGSLSLCISGSFLSIKTAALLWFLYGALQRADEATVEWGGQGRFAAMPQIGNSHLMRSILRLNGPALNNTGYEKCD